MGMYTKLHLEGKLNDEGVKVALPVLEWMLANIEVQKAAPDPRPDCLKRLERTTYMLDSNSYYHIPFSSSRIHNDRQGNTYFFFNCDLKNYQDEIQTLLDWLAPYTEEAWGFTRYEEDLHITEVHIDNGVLRTQEVQ